MRLLQGAVTEGMGVKTRGGDVEVDVEGAVGQDRDRKADALQPVEHDAPAGEELLSALLAHGDGFGGEGRQRGLLNGRRGAQEVVDRQVLGGGHEFLGKNRPAQAPSRHPEVLGEGVDDDRIRIGFQDGARRPTVLAWISQAQVDLVDDPPGAAFARQLADRCQLLEGNRRARGVGGGRQHHRARLRSPCRLGCGPVHLVSAGRTGGCQNDPAAVGLHQLPVAGVGRVGDDDVVAGLRGGGGHQQKRRRRTGGDDDPGGIDLDAVPVPVETRNGLTQCEQAQGGGVGKWPAVHDAAHLLADRGRGAEIRLTQAELGDRVALRLEDSGAFADAHRIEGLSGCGPGGDLHDDSLTRGQNRTSVPLPVAEGQRLCATGEGGVLNPYGWRGLPAWFAGSGPMPSPVLSPPELGGIRANEPTWRWVSGEAVAECC